MIDVLLGVGSFVIIIGYAVYEWTHWDGPMKPPYPLFGIYWDDPRYDSRDREQAWDKP